MGEKEVELDVENLGAKQEPFWNGCLMLIQWIVMNNPTKILKFENHNVFVMMCFTNWSLPYTTGTRRFPICDNLYTVLWTTQLELEKTINWGGTLSPQGPSSIVVYHLSNMVQLA